MVEWWSGGEAKASPTIPPRASVYSPIRNATHTHMKTQPPKRRALWPAIALLICIFFMPDTPASLIERGRVAEGRAALQQIRGHWCAVLRHCVCVCEAVRWAEGGRGDVARARWGGSC